MRVAASVWPAFTAWMPTIVTVGAGWTNPCAHTTHLIAGGTSRGVGAISSGHVSGNALPAKDNTESTSTVAAGTSASLTAHEHTWYKCEAVVDL